MAAGVNLVRQWGIQRLCESVQNAEQVNIAADGLASLPQLVYL